MKSKSLIASILAVSTALANTTVDAVDPWKCNSGVTPKFRDNNVDFYVEPEIWDNPDARESIFVAAEEWNKATGWKLNIGLKRGDGRGEFGDGQSQIRLAWIRDRTIAHSIRLPEASNDDQCVWYDSDIQINYKHWIEYDFGGRTLDTIMYHEFGHAVGEQHSKDLSLLNNDYSGTAYTNPRGLFGKDITFVRDVYGVNEENLEPDLRTDNVILDGTTLTSYFLIDADNSTVSAPYTVTNTGPEGRIAKIEFYAVQPGGDAFSDEAVVLHTAWDYVASGATVSEVVEFPNEAPEGIEPWESIDIGFRVYDGIGNLSNNSSTIVKSFFLLEPN